MEPWIIGLVIVVFGVVLFVALAVITNRKGD